MVTEDRLLTVGEVAQTMRVGSKTVRRWLTEGKLRGMKPGGSKTGWRIRYAELARFMRDAEERAS